MWNLLFNKIHHVVLNINNDSSKILEEGAVIKVVKKILSAKHIQYV